MSKLLLIVSAEARSQFRWAKQHVYLWLVLGPIILGATAFTASRVAENLPAWQMSRWLIVSLAIIFEALAIGISLSRASAELYHLRRAESYFDALPVSPATHLNAALTARLTRTIVIAAIALIAHLRFGRGSHFDAETLIALALFTPLTALAEMIAAMNWIHWNHTKDKRAAFAALIALLVTLAPAGALLAVAIRPDFFSSAFIARLTGVSLALIVALYLASVRLHDAWRKSDMEYARRLQSPNRLSIVSAKMIGRRFAPQVAAQLARDLQLTLRAFSSAVYVAFVISMLWPVLTVALLVTDSLPQYAIRQGFLEISWRPEVMAIKIACVFQTASLAALVAVLVAYELPMMWLERATSVKGLDIVQAKLWYARLVSLPAPLIVWAAGILTGKVPLIYAVPLLAECVLLWLLVSTVIGGLAYEIPNRPGLSIIIMLTVGLAGGLLSALLWLIGIIAYVQAKDTLVERGRHRARYYLMTEGD